MLNVHSNVEGVPEQDDGASSRKRRRAVVASTLGSIIEWYDFSLYGVGAGLIFPTIFFPASDPLSATINAYMVFVVAYFARPIGALIFGHYGDRIGRKGALVATVLLMGVGTALVAVVPSYASIGIAGAFTLAALRFCQGVGVGGEWAGSVLVAMEWSSRERRGLYASWPQVGVPAGVMLAYLTFTLTSALTGSAFLDWGWRIPFALSVLLVILGLYLRVGLEETPDFKSIASTRRVSERPVMDAIRQTWPQIISTTFVRLSDTASFLIYAVFVFGLAHHAGFDRTATMSTVVVGLLAEVIAIPISGMLCDRFGRRPVFLAGAALAGVCPFVYFAAYASGSLPAVFLVTAVAFVSHGIQYAAQGSMISESFPTHLRYSGASIGYQLAAMLAGGMTPFVATWLFARDPNGFQVAVFLLLCAVVSGIAACTLRSTAAPERAMQAPQS